MLNNIELRIDGVMHLSVCFQEGNEKLIQHEDDHMSSDENEELVTCHVLSST